LTNHPQPKHAISATRASIIVKSKLSTTKPKVHTNPIALKSGKTNSNREIQELQKEQSKALQQSNQTN